MTNAVVWKPPGSSEIWAVADSLVTAARIGPLSGVSSVTDQAIKILKLEVCTHSVLSRGEPFGLRLQIGLCFAGTVLPALMTHAAAAHILANLHPAKPGLPSMAKIAELIRVLSESYILAAAKTYGSSPLPTCEFVIFGDDVSQKEPLSGGPSVAYRVLPARRGAFRQVVSRVNLEKGKMAVIGTDTAALLADIKELQRTAALNIRGVEPRIALGNRMIAQKHDTVGGTLQFGVLSGNFFELFGSAWDSRGHPQQNWLGFDCQGELSKVVGMPIVIPAKP